MEQVVNYHFPFCNKLYRNSSLLPKSTVISKVYKLEMAIKTQKETQHKYIVSKVVPSNFGILQVMYLAKYFTPGEIFSQFLQTC